MNSRAERELRAALVDLRLAVGALRSISMTLKKDEQTHQPTLAAIEEPLQRLEAERDRLA